MKVFISVVLSLICYIGVAQPPTLYKTPYNPLGGKNVMVNSTGGFIGDSTVVLPVYSDTLKANKSRTSLYPGSMIRVANDYYYRSADTTRWVLIATTSSNCGGTRLINGSITWSGTGYAFNATQLDYGIICGLYHSDTATLTLANSDPTYDRIDVFYADVNGQVGILQGTASPAPVKPSVNPLTQIEISFCYVTRGSVTPPQTATIIYNELAVGEWARASSVPSINFAYTINPYDGLVSTYFSSMASGTFISYQNGSLLNINNYQYLKFYFRRNSALGSDPASTLVLDFYNGNTLITSSLFINDGAYGYDASVIGSYQLITVPISSFTFADSLFDKLYITNTTGSLSSCQLDKIYLLGSVPPPPVISNAWVRSGNASTNPATDYVGTSDSTDFNIGTNGQKRLGFRADGIKESLDTTKLILVFDPITGDAYYIHQPSIYALGCLKIYDSTSSGITRKYIRDTCSGGGGSTPTLQEVLAAGNVLIGSNSILTGDLSFYSTFLSSDLFKISIDSIYGAIERTGFLLEQATNKSILGDFRGAGTGNLLTIDNTPSADASYFDNTAHDLKLGINTNIPDSNLTIIGSLRIDNSRAQAGYVWTSTGTNGGGDWKPAAGGSSPWTQGTGIIYPTTITDVVGIGATPTAGDDNGLLQISKTGGVTGFLIGTDVRVTGTSGVEVDNNFFSTSTAAIAKGIHAVATGTSSSIYGVEGEATATTSGNSFGISGVAGANTGDAIGGYFSATATDTTKAFGVYSAAGYNYFNGKVGIRNSHPDSVLTVIGGARFDNGRAQAGYVWTSTGTNGGGDWKPSSGGGWGTTKVIATLTGDATLDLASSGFSMSDGSSVKFRANPATGEYIFGDYSGDISPTYLSIRPNDAQIDLHTPTVAIGDSVPGIFNILNSTGTSGISFDGALGQSFGITSNNTTGNGTIGFHAVDAAEIRIETTPDSVYQFLNSNSDEGELHLSTTRFRSKIYSGAGAGGGSRAKSVLNFPTYNAILGNLWNYYLPKGSGVLPVNVYGNVADSSGIISGTISGTYGGTGVNNGSKTVTLGGNLTTSGAFNTTLTSTATTSVTLPTTGTLSTLNGSETFTNKTLTSPTLTTPVLGTPSSGTLTNCTGLPISGTTGYGTGVATALAVNTNAIGGMLTGASSFSANVLTVLSDFRPTKTITAAGTTGAQTINKTTGTVNFAAGASTLVVTNSFATANSVIIVTVYGTDATATSARVTKASGSFTITLNAAATAETAVGFMVTN